jgi:hypothetical protein
MGEEVITSLIQFADANRVASGTFQATGSFHDVTLGYYDLEAQTYRNESFPERLEVLTMTGTIARGEAGERMIHAHVVVAGADYTTRGGCLVEATVGATLETVVETWPGTVHRRRDPDTGLDLWDLSRLRTLSA